MSEPLNGKWIGSHRDDVPRDMVARGWHQESYLSHHRSAVSECDCIKIALIMFELNNRGLWPLSRIQRDLSATSMLKKLRNFKIAKGLRERPRLPNLSNRRRKANEADRRGLRSSGVSGDMP